MKAKQKLGTALMIILSVAVVLTGGYFYIAGVQRSLWMKSVTDILEVTVQGRHALDTYVEKDLEQLHWLASELSCGESGDAGIIQSRILGSGGQEASYLCVDLAAGLAYTPMRQEGYAPEELELFRTLQGHGVREPFLDERTGVWTLGCYERFLFADGAGGLVQKSLPLGEIAQRFSLSFYDDTGFSYVVNRQGDILIRSQHRNSNRTFQNLFDIIDIQGNDPQQVGSFAQALEDGLRGAARFQYQGEDYVFCYVPMESVEDWYVVSIVPNRVIMEQADHIVHNSQVFLTLILSCVFVLAGFFLLYRKTAKRVLAAEEEARRAAESANRAKSRFLSNMSHDIRTPMNAIMGMAKLAADHVGEPEKVRGYLKNISQSGQLLVGLINDILDLSKIESGKMALNEDDACLESLFTNMIHIIQPMAEKKKLRFGVRLHGIRHEQLCFDALRMNQIMLNLLSNAVKFTPEGGTVTVDVTERPSQRENRVHLTLRVADSGIGMEPEFLEHIFDAFTREQDNRIGQIEGSGLGMAIAKMLVDMMEGTISVESRPGEGTAFTVELDLRLPGQPPREEELPGIRVLVADGDPGACRSAEEFLRELGALPETAADRRTAVEKAVSAHAAGKDYSLVLLDWDMQEFSAAQAAREIRRGTGDQVPALIVSAYDWSGIEEQAAAAGVDGFIQKPIFSSALVRCIRQYVLHEEQPVPWRDEAADLSGRRILLAEDNALNQEIALELLTGMGAEVETADDGQACVEQFERSEPGYFDLILMDVQMPRMNGYEATKRIRGLGRPDGAAIPIFAMTADAFTEDIQESRRAGMNAHLAKPLDIPAMVREIRKYLDL